ncbi:MAG: peroxiredoxin family protein [Fimbriimonas sp.]
MRFRPILITGPLAVALGIASAYLIIQSQPSKPTSEIDTAEPRHPVTSTMQEEADEVTRAKLPTYTRKDETGQVVTLGGLRAKPQFVVFIKEGCPCSFDSAPLFDRLYRHLGGKVDFVGVIDKDVEGAKKWAGAMLPPFPILPDPKLEIIHHYKAPRSVYSVLLSPEGKVVKMWPGYSKRILLEMNKTMSKAAGVEAKPFDPQYAPIRDSSGCDFE